MTDHRATDHTATGRLRIRARDHEDLRCLSSLLQDALVPVRDVAWLASQQRFVMVVNRFCRERLPVAAQARAMTTPDQAQSDDVAFGDVADLPTFYRVNSGLCFDRVTAVQTRGLDLSDREHILSLLALSPETGTDIGADADDRLCFYFSGGGMIRLMMRGLWCHLDDICDPWPSLNQPRHDVQD